MKEMKPIHVIGGGLAGSEAAWQIAGAGVPVVLHEMRPVRMTDAHKSDGLAELVCSNSFRSDDWETNAVGLLHEEMRRAGSLILAAGDRHKLPAGGALAVDRDNFSADVTQRLEAHPLVTIERAEIAGLPPADWDSVIVATGPLTSPALSEAVRAITGEADLAFFDAIAPVIHRESIDTSIAWFQSRYDKTGPAGTGADYLNCPMTREEYGAFIDALLAGEKTSFKEWEASTPYFDGCLPIEVMAERGRDTLRYGPMKPVGLDDPRTGPLALRRRAAAPGQCARHAVEHGRLPDQAEARRAGAHLPHDPRPRRSRVRAPRRAASQHLPQQPEAARRFAAPEGDAAPALRRTDHRRRRLRRKRRHRPAGRDASRRPSGSVVPITAPPATTALGALIGHITGGHLSVDDETGEGARARSFQPMNINYGLLPDIDAPAAGRRRQAPQGQGQGPREKARHVGARPRRHRSLARGACGASGGRIALALPASCDQTLILMFLASDIIVIT